MYLSSSCTLIQSSPLATSPILPCVNLPQLLHSLISIAMPISILTVFHFPFLLTSLCQSFSLLCRHFDSLMHCCGCLCLSTHHVSKSVSVLQRRVLVVMEMYTWSVFGMSVHYNSVCTCVNCISFSVFVWYSDIMSTEVEIGQKMIT